MTATRTKISPDSFLLGAAVYDAKKKELAGKITADKANPELYPGDRYHFYCPECEELGHFTRVVRIKETRRGRSFLPAKFDLYDRTHSTHRCQHPVRFRELDLLAERYEAEKIGNHQYIFTMNMAGARADGILGVHKASRLAKLHYALIYDPEVMNGQAVRINGAVMPYTDLFKSSAAYSDVKAGFYKASVFRPIARADHRLQYRWQGEIRGMDPFMTGGDGADLRAYYPALSCIDNPTFYTVKKMTERNGGNKVAPVMVFACAVLNDSAADGRGPHIRYLIDNAVQVSEWKHEHRNSDEATSQQQPPPAPYDSPLFLHYRR